MQKKIVEILVVTLFIATAVIPAVGTINEKINQTNNTYLQPTVEWVKTYGGDEFDMFRCVQHTSDGGYIAFGEYEEDDNNYARLIKLNSTGDEEWTVINYDINGTGFDVDELMDYVIQTSDGGYLASGRDMYYYIEGDFWYHGGFLWKTDSDGATEWLKYYYDVDEVLYMVIAQLTEVDDGYIGGGLTLDAEESGPDYDLNFSIVKVDFDGNLLWYKQYDLYGYEYGSSFDITDPDGGYFLSGTSSINDIYGDDDDVICIMKANSTGVKQWQQIFNGSKADFCNARGCCQTSDGGYMIVGTTESYNVYGNWDIWQIKTDANGNKEWENFFGEPGWDMTWSMQKTSDGGYIILIDYNQGFVDDILLVKTDEEGNVIWNYLIVQTGRHQPIFIDETDDGGYIICGRTGNPDAKTTDSFLLKVGPFDNQRPSKPTIDGKSKGKPFVNYTFTASSTDPDGDTLSYMWDWADGNTTLTDQVEVSYSWAKRGTYNIKAKAIDEHGGESEWETFEFNVPRTNYHSFILRLFERFPNLFPILRYLMGL